MPSSVRPLEHDDLAVVIRRATSGPGSVVSMVKASPTLVLRQIPAMQNHGSSALVKSHLCLRLAFGSLAAVNS